MPYIEIVVQIPPISKKKDTEIHPHHRNEKGAYEAVGAKLVDMEI
jgi:hypothetical protein